MTEADDVLIDAVVTHRSERFMYNVRPGDAPVITMGKDTLPLRYRGAYAEVTIDVLSNASPVVTRDSTGAVLIRLGEHVIRLGRAP